ncbi:hypothetical protein FOL47_004608 [Perkinsus chesapeaki]|uniref:F-box domain-containing protein n=1 Tax=Perkinsus chesapeaki TaxID=330153 RepID=A0A7J6M2Z2_PERCH|nr:hypothetical protein FOL47_004608 [Perkinsus chesapeaki]
MTTQRLPLYRNNFNCGTLLGNWYEERLAPQQRARYGEGYFSAANLLLANPNSRTYVTTSKHLAEEGLGLDKRDRKLREEELMAALSSTPASDLLGGACPYDSDMTTTARDSFRNPRDASSLLRASKSSAMMVCRVGTSGEELEEYRRRWTKGNLMDVVSALPDSSISGLLQRGRELVIGEEWRGVNCMDRLPSEVIYKIGLCLGFRSLSAMAQTSRRVCRILGPVWRETGLLLFDGFAIDGEVFDDPSLELFQTSLSYTVDQQKDAHRFWPIRCGQFMAAIAFEECPYLALRDGIPSSVQLRGSEVIDVTAESLEDASPSQHLSVESCSFTCPSKFEIPTSHPRGIYLEYLVDLHFSPSATRAVIGVIDGSHKSTSPLSVLSSTTTAATTMAASPTPSGKFLDDTFLATRTSKLETCDFALETDPSMWAVAFGPLSAVLSSRGRYFDQFDTYTVAGAEDPSENKELLRDCLESALLDVVSVRVGIYLEQGKVAFFRRVDSVGHSSSMLPGDSSSYDCTGFIYQTREDQPFLRPALMCCNVNGDYDFVRTELTAVCNKPPYPPHDNIDALDFPNNWEYFAQPARDVVLDHSDGLRLHRAPTGLESLDDISEVLRVADEDEMSLIGTPESGSPRDGALPAPRWVSLSSDTEYEEETPVIQRNVRGRASSATSPRSSPLAYHRDFDDNDSEFGDFVASMA